MLNVRSKCHDETKYLANMQIHTACHCLSPEVPK